MNDGQTVSYDGVNYTAVREGLATILVAKVTSLHSAESKIPKQKSNNPVQSVFYNPIQQFNRDLSILATKAFGEDYLARVQSGKSRRGGKRRRDKDQKEESSKKQCANGISREEGAAISNVNNNHSVSQISQILHHSHSSLSEERVVSIDLHTEVSKRRQEFRILDALSATGLRALRYAHELPFVTSVTANDLSRQATDIIKLNVKHNELESKVRVTTSNANAHMYSALTEEDTKSYNSKYQVIDLDPYGTVAPFIDAALQALANDGLLCVTSTDTAIFASNSYPEKAYSQYGGLPVKGYHSHEVGLRLLLHAIASSGARYGIAIEPLLSLSIDFYARLFVRVRKSPADVKHLAGKTMIVFCCDSGCGAWKTQYLAKNSPMEAKDGTLWYKHTMAQAPTSSVHCEHCGFKMHIAGPMYGGPIHNPAFIQRVIDCISDLDPNTYNTLARIEGMLQTALEEIPPESHIIYEPKNFEDNTSTGIPIPRLDPIAIDSQPFFFNPSLLAKVLHTQSPPEAAIKGALRNAGYFATRSHTKPGSVKTNAPWSFLWHMMCEWVRQRAPVRDGLLKEGMAGWRIAVNASVNTISVKEGKAAAIVNTTDFGEAKGQSEVSTGNPRKEDDLMSKVIFDENLGKKDPKMKKLLRYQMNPRPNWGPMSKAKSEMS